MGGTTTTLGCADDPADPRLTPLPDITPECQPDFTPPVHKLSSGEVDGEVALMVEKIRERQRQHQSA
jgi:hypothetical protein